MLVPVVADYLDRAATAKFLHLLEIIQATAAAHGLDFQHFGVVKKRVVGRRETRQLEAYLDELGLVRSTAFLSLRVAYSQASTIHSLLNPAWLRYAGGNREMAAEIRSLCDELVARLSLSLSSPGRQGALPTAPSPPLPIQAMFKPPKIKKHRDLIITSLSELNESTAGMGRQMTLRSTEGTPEASTGLSLAPTPGDLAISAVFGVKTGAAAQEHSVKLSRATVQRIKLILALLPAQADNPLTIKQYLEQAHELFEAKLRAASQLNKTGFLE